MKIDSVNYRVIIKTSAEWDEYIIRLYHRDNMQLCLGTYHTDDREDASGTAAWLLDWAEKNRPVTPTIVESEDIPF